MNILEAMMETEKEARRNDCKMYLYEYPSSYQISPVYKYDWLFQAYPGGRKILSPAGAKLVAEAKGQ